MQTALPLKRDSLSRSSHALRPAEVKREWFVIDATEARPGRLATTIAARLCGKHKPIYTPHVDCGDAIIVVNVDRMVFSGNKGQHKVYHWHTGYPGGIKSRTAGVLMKEHPERVLEKAVKGMISRGPLARQRLKHLYIYRGPDHPHQGMQPQPLDLGALNPKNKVRVHIMSDKQSNFRRDFQAAFREEFQEGMKPFIERLEKIDASLVSLANTMRENADEMRDNNRRLTASQTATLETLEHIDRNTAATAAALAQVLQKLNP